MSIIYTSVEPLEPLPIPQHHVSSFMIVARDEPKPLKKRVKHKRPYWHRTRW